MNGVLDSGAHVFSGIIGNAHANDLNAAVRLSLDCWWDIRTVRSKQSKK